MRKKIISSLVATLLILSFILIIPGSISLSKKSIETCSCDRPIECSILIADNTKVYEINNAEDIVWQYNIGSADIEKLYNGNILMAQTFVVSEVNILGAIVWQFSTGLAGIADV
jgi:hypothetical protein